MPDPEPFDAFYLRSRDRLLHQAYALTGDLKASRSAVRDTFVAAWQHWRKVGRLEDPEAWARPHAWQHAQRRHTARVWHREKGLDPEVQATLEALGRLTTLQRRVLLLTHLAAVSMPEMAREVGRTPDTTARELQVATDQFAMHRDVPSTHVAGHLRRLGEVTAGVRWPRVTIIRRHGSARRRTHTVAGAAAAVAAVTVTAVVVTDTDGARPTLETQSLHSAVLPADGPSSPAPEEPTPTGEADPLPESAMLGAPALDQAIGGSWRERGTHANAMEDDGSFMPCQAARYADPEARAVWVRKLVGGTKDDRGRPAATAYLLSQLSRGEKPAGRALEAATEWFEACAEPRVQLIGTWEVQGVGDEAVQMVLRDWRSGSSLVVGMARTGRYLTGAVVRYRDGQDQTERDRQRHATLLGRAVGSLCERQPGGRCDDEPRLQARDAGPVAVGGASGAERAGA